MGLDEDGEKMLAVAVARDGFAVRGLGRGSKPAEMAVTPLRWRIATGAYTAPRLSPRVPSASWP
jgi:hypothetical protein